MTRRRLMTLYRRLFRAYGPQGWWPAEAPFEVMVGAVLTQNTAWVNVEKAIANLRRAGSLEPETLAAMADSRLAGLIRPSGYFNVKTARLKNLCRWFMGSGGWPEIEARPTGDLREDLLGVKGVGPETADDILLYALERPVFVIDAYTRRLLRAHGWIEGGEPYESLRLGFEARLETDVPLYNEYHALIVRHAKEPCSGQRGCRHCRVMAPIA